jgi:hypothetical protein
VWKCYGNQRTGETLKKLIGSTCFTIFPYFFIILNLLHYLLYSIWFSIKATDLIWNFGMYLLFTYFISIVCCSARTCDAIPSWEKNSNCPIYFLFASFFLGCVLHHRHSNSVRTSSWHPWDQTWQPLKYDHFNLYHFAFLVNIEAKPAVVFFNEKYLINIIYIYFWWSSTL